MERWFLYIPHESHEDRSIFKFQKVQSAVGIRGLGHIVFLCVLLVSVLSLVFFKGRLLQILGVFTLFNSSILVFVDPVPCDASVIVLLTKSQWPRVSVMV